MTSADKKTLSYGRLCKLLNDLGPYFRKPQSTESTFFFDCLEICIDSEKEPEQREFYGWWLLLEKEEEGFYYQRFDGRYNEDGDWVVETLSVQNQQQVDQSFKLFIPRLNVLINQQTGLELKERQDVLIE